MQRTFRYPLQFLKLNGHCLCNNGRDLPAASAYGRINGFGQNKFINY